MHGTPYVLVLTLVCLGLLHGQGVVQVYAVDKSVEAVAWAKLNVQRLGLTDRVQVCPCILAISCSNAIA